MRITGLNGSGINLPHYIAKSEINIPYGIMQHKYGAVATWSHCTDTYKPTVSGHAMDAEINAFKYNLAMTALISPSVDGYAGQFKDVLQTGRVRFGGYEWTGQAYNSDNSIDTDAHIENEYNNIKNGLGYYPSFASYSYGRQTFREIFKQYYLGVRNSNYGLANISYDIADTSSLPTTTRQGDMPGTRSEIMAQCNNALTNAIAESGWYTDFTHWHTVEDGELEEFLSNQRTTMGINNVITLDFMTAIEYMKLRQTITKIVFFEANGKIYVTTEMPYIPVFRRDINTTISVEIDLAGTALADKEIKTNYGAQKVANNKFIVEVPINDFCIIEPEPVGDYLDFDLPNILSVTKESNSITVNTDKNTNVVLFIVPAGAELYDATVESRSNLMSKAHNIDVSGVNLANSDIYFGVITKEKQSILSEKYNF